MRRFAVLACALACSVGFTSTARADEKSDAILAELATQLKEMRGELNALRQENQRLQAVVAQQQQQAQPAAQGEQAAANIWDEPRQHIRVPNRPGLAPPSWLDAAIENNRQRTLEAWARANAGERLSAERLARIEAESRAIGTVYCPRPLREVALAGGDVKASRDSLVSARSSDFDTLFGQVQVKEYLKIKAARLSGDYTTLSRTTSGGTGTIAPATIRLVDRLRKDMEDATILYGPSGLAGPAPAGLGTAEELTRRRRDSSNPGVSGPTRDTLAIGRRSAAVDAAVSADVDIELLLRANQIRQANGQMSGYTLTPGDIAADLAQVNDVLAGKVQRESVPVVRPLQP